MTSTVTADGVDFSTQAGVERTAIILRSVSTPRRQQVRKSIENCQRHLLELLLV